MSVSYGLIFDVDGVIADTEAVNARASIKVFSELFGVEGVRRQDFEAGLGRGAEAYILAAAEVHGLTLSEEQVAAATAARQANFLAILEQEPLPPFPGVLNLMEAALAHPEWAVAIATSSTRQKSEAVLKAAGVPYTRMVYICGDDVTRKKPDPQLFLLACERLGLSPRRCVVIEDAPNGVQAALAAGCRCVAVTNSTDADRLAAAHLVVSSLEELDLARLHDLLHG